MSEKKIIEIGKTADGESVELGLYKFIQTRGMIQASSGGGKSWLARVIAEKTQRAGIPVWTIDPEGEYTTLREKFEVVIFGASEDADLPTDERTLSLVLPELFARNISVVFDLSENSLEEKQAVAAAVCTFLLSVPKLEQKPVLLVVDEAQVLAPEREATDSVVALSDVASRGRKRRLGLLVVTQRLSALNKNLTTQLQNRFVGFCIEDIEIARAAKLINEHKKDNAAELPGFNPGDFFAVGGAVNFRRVVKFHSAPVETTHGDNLDADFGSSAKPPIASESLAELIKVLREKLTVETEPDESDTSDSLDENKKLKAEISELRQKLRAAENAPARTVIEFPEKEVAELKNFISEAEGKLSSLAEDLSIKIAEVFDERTSKLTELVNKLIPLLPELPKEKFTPRAQETKVKTAQFTRPQNSGLPQGMKKILYSIAQLSNGATRKQITLLTQYKTSTRNEYLRNLENLGLTEKSGDRFVMTEKGFSALGDDYEPLPSGAALREHWLNTLPQGEAAILGHIFQAHPNSISRERLSDLTGYAASTRNEYIRKLAARELITFEFGAVAASAELFE